MLLSAVHGLATFVLRRLSVPETVRVAVSSASGLPIRQKLNEIVKGCATAARRHQCSQSMVWWRLLMVWLRFGITPREALRAGLADPRIPRDQLMSCISKTALVHLQRRVNPDHLYLETGDKQQFDARCRSMGLPVPRLLAVFAGDAECPAGYEGWDTFFLHGLPDTFVIKPARGGYGEGVRVVTRRGETFHDGAGGGAWSATGLYYLLRSGTRHRRFLIQERLASHPLLAELSGTPFLQTIRLVTFIHDDGHAEVYYGNCKVIAGTAVADNFRRGMTGNLITNVSPDGVLGPALSIAADGVGTVATHVHPGTGRQITGLQLPFWHEAQALVCQAAELFRPVRTLGWDVALTPEGPVILEANHFWDPLPLLAVGCQAPGATHNGMVDLIAALRRAKADGPVPPGSLTPGLTYSR